MAGSTVCSPVFLFLPVPNAIDQAAPDFNLTRLLHGPKDSSSAPKAARRDAKEIKHLTLQRSELRLEALHDATGVAEQVPLGVAE